MKQQKFPVLDHGHIILLDYMGSDQDIVTCARTSYHKDSTRQVSDDRNLIRYLMRHRHTSPFESAVVKLHVKLPIFVERQWARHRTASWNEVSARYSVLPEETYLPEPKHINEQTQTNKQGRSESYLPEHQSWVFRENTKRLAETAFEGYNVHLNQLDIARELARINLPLSTYTEKVWTCNLHNVLHFLKLRMDEHAQWEIRQYANVFGREIIAKLFPLTWEAFVDYVLESVTLSRLEIEAVANGFSYLKQPPATKRENEEFQIKRDKLNLNWSDKQ